ncbi:MAG: DNA topoisomerase 4 subunit A [Clostridia bacterium]|nr:DNA topoisomerase 4 subunit A [Clostridia bacterium]
MSEFDKDEQNEEKENLARRTSKKGGEVVFAKDMFNKPIEQVIHDSMLPYSEHVILDRALPRVEDGLKPVQRRILFTLSELGITPDKPHKKSARIVGECLGKYHPHGDTSVYDAMVRLAQNFNMRAVLVDGHGNFGSVDGDDAAAMRYTEARMAPLALEILRDLDKETVDWTLNFDDTLKEPVTLPCRFPNILVNGASGIAVGLATNIPTHNLGEVIDGAVALIDDPKITLGEMMKKIKGPDFPTGGYIIAGDDLVKAYETGKGKITIRAKVHIENIANDKKNIVITELPYQVNKAVLLQKILELSESKKDELAGISEILDESDRQGMRAVVRVKKDYDAEKILNVLFKNTQLETSFGINMVAIADGRPQQMGLIKILEYYVNYQREVIYRRTKFDLDAAKERAHILRGLVIAVKNIDEVVKIIKKSGSPSEAKTALRIRFDLSDRQAQAILDLRLAKLTSLEIYKLETELAELEKKIVELTAVLGSKKLQLDIVKNEMLEIKKAYKDPRKSIIIKSLDEFNIAATDNTEPVVSGVVATTENGFVKFMTSKYFASATKTFGERSGMGEIYRTLTKTSTDKKILIFTNLGNAFKIDVAQIPECKWKDKGTELRDLCEAKKNEIPVYVLEIPEKMPEGSLLFFTKDGMIKKTEYSEYTLLKSAYQAIKMKDSDEVVRIEPDTPDTTIFFVTKNGMALNALKNDIPVQGRISGGVKGINLNDGDEVVFIGQAKKGVYVILLTDKAYAKKVNTGEIPETARYRKGVKIYDLKPQTTGSKIVGAVVESNNIEVIAEGTDETLSAISETAIVEDTCGSKGRKLSLEGKELAGAYFRKINV